MGYCWQSCVLNLFHRFFVKLILPSGNGVFMCPVNFDRETAYYILLPVKVLFLARCNSS